MFLANQRNRFFSRFSLSDHLDIGVVFEHTANPGAHEFMIINNENSDQEDLLFSKTLVFCYIKQN